MESDQLSNRAPYSEWKSPTPRPLLPGAERDGTFVARSSLDGSRQREDAAILPLIAFEDGSPPVMIGTGAVLSNEGLFVTARHSLMHLFDPPRGFPTANWADFRQRPGTHVEALHFNKEGQYYRRPVLRFSIHNQSDIAVGLLAPGVHKRTGEPLLNQCLGMSIRRPVKGELISTFAYPDTQIGPETKGWGISIRGNFFSGRVVEVSEDKVQSDMHIHPGASGGPVFDELGGLIGVCRSSLAVETNVSFFTPIVLALPLGINDVLLPGADVPTKVTLLDLALRKLVGVISDRSSQAYKPK